MQVGTCVALLVGLNGLFIGWAAAYLSTRRLGRHWTFRRTHACATAGARGLLMNLVQISTLVLNSLVLRDPSGFCEPGAVMTVASFVRSTGWASILFLAGVELDSIIASRPPSGSWPAKALWFAMEHWGKLLLWSLMVGVLPCTGWGLPA